MQKVVRDGHAPAAAFAEPLGLAMTPARPPSPSCAVKRVLVFLRASCASVGHPYPRDLEQQHTEQLDWLEAFRTSPVTTDAVRPPRTSQDMRQQGTGPEADK